MEQQKQEIKLTDAERITILKRREAYQMAVVLLAEYKGFSEGVGVSVSDDCTTLIISKGSI